MHRLVATLLLSIALGGSSAFAADVTVPMRLDAAFLERLVTAAVFTEPDETARPWVQSNGCGELRLWDAQVDGAGGRIRVLSRGAADWGLNVGGSCLTLLDWEGSVEVIEEPLLDPVRPVVRFRVVDSHVYGAERRKTFGISRLWDWIKDGVHPQLERVEIDLDTAIEEVRALLPLVLPAFYAELGDATLASVVLTGARVEADALVVDLRVTAPDRPATESRPEPPLDVAEIERWDAFLTFVVRHAAAATETNDIRIALLKVLLDGRYEIVDVLAGTGDEATDPVPRLFRATWTRLAPVLRRIEPELAGADALRYASFLAAGDVLRALEELGPQTGLDISADGLRRLARIVAPEETGDPLRYHTSVDPSLRERFGFGPPLDVPAPEPAPTPSPTPPPEGGREPASGAVDPTERRSGWIGVPLSRVLASATLGLLLDLLIADAHAVELGVEDVRGRLDGWAPGRDDIDAYLPLVRTVLVDAADHVLKRDPLDGDVAPLFEPLVLATAWKESCWRQFVRSAGGVVPIESRAGAVGIMQVNPRVWRGFYEPEALRRDVGYNARAGSEILRHYLVDYAIRKREHEKGGGTDALVRATYAAYNGGPSHLARYRQPGTRKSLRAIDAAFWEIFRQVRAGDTHGIKACYGL
jgi:hypothetical protein